MKTRCLEAVQTTNIVREQFSRKQQHTKGSQVHFAVSWLSSCLMPSLAGLAPSFYHHTDDSFFLLFIYLFIYFLRPWIAASEIYTQAPRKPHAGRIKVQCVEVPKGNT